MDRNNIERSERVDRYLQGKLTADEERAFEEAYLADPELLDELILTEKLREGLSRHARRAPGDRRTVAGSGPGWLRVLASPQYAAAATVLLAFSMLASTTLLVQNQGLRRDGVDVAAAMPTRLLTLVRVRGAESPNVIETGSRDEWLVFRLGAGQGDYDAYRATVTRVAPGEPELVLRQNGLEPTAEGDFAVGLPSTLLGAGAYEIEIEGRMSGWPADRYDQVTLTPLTIRAVEP